MPLQYFLGDLLTDGADRVSPVEGALIGRLVLDGAVLGLTFVPVDKAIHFTL